MLHGLRNEEGKKDKKVFLNALINQFQEVIGFSTRVSEQMARFLVEVPNEDGKVEYSEKAIARRKDIH